MEQVELDAICIVKGEMQGDKYLWDHVWHDAEGNPHTGGWRSYLREIGELEDITEE